MARPKITPITMVDPVYEITLDLTRWTVGNFEDFLAAVNANDFTAIGNLCAKVISVWPFNGDPRNPEDYRRLMMGDLQPLLRAVNGAIREIFRAGEDS